MQTKIKSFKNYFCDAISCGVGEFIDVYDNFDEENLIASLSQEEISIICQYATLKNKIAGVGELFLKVPYASIGRKALEMFEMDGKVVISAKQKDTLTTNDFVGDRVVLQVEDLLDYKEGALTDIADFLGRTEMPVLINLGRDLEEVGRLVNRYGKSPVEILEDFGFLDRECYVYGLNFIDKDDQKLLANYNTCLIFSPRSDAEEGKGAINLYNFIYNRLKFVFSSGKCYNINMLAEGKLASLNTNNLMYERGLVKEEELLDALSYKIGENIVEIDNYSLSECLFDQKVELEQFKKKYLSLREKILEIIKKIKE